MQENAETIAIPVIYIEVFTLMLVSFLIGYLFAYYYHKSRYTKKLDIQLKKIRDNFSLTKDANTSKAKSPNTISAQQEENEEFDLQVHKRAFSPQVQQAAAHNEDGLYIDFERIGYASIEASDDLQKIIGIGPYTEEKLNDIGIFTFEQISRFNDKDIETVTELIKFFPDRIKNDKWVSKAKSLASQKKNKLKKDSRDQIKMRKA